MAPEKRILILTHNYPRWEGDFAGVFLQSLVSHFAIRNIETLIVAPHTKGAQRFEHHDKVHVKRFRYGTDGMETLAYTGSMHNLAGSLLGLLKFIFFLKCYFWSAFFSTLRFKPQAISAQWMAPSGIVGWFLSLMTRKPLYVTSHGTDIVLLEKSGIGRKLAKRVYRRARRVFVVSSFLKGRLVELGIVPAERVEVLPMPARDDVFKPMEAEPARPPLIICVARFTVQKQLPVLFEALQKIKTQGLEFKTEIYGKGELESDLKQKIAKLGLSEQIVMKPPVDQRELAGRYSAATIAVLPSINEGFGLTLVEAQLCGVAVVGARSGGITDIIEHNKTGLLFEPGDCDELAEHLSSLLQDQSLRERLAEQGRAAALQKFSAETIADRYIQELGL